MLCQLLKDYPLKAQDIKRDILSPFSLDILQQIGIKLNISQTLHQNGKKLTDSPILVSWPEYLSAGSVDGLRQTNQIHRYNVIKYVRHVPLTPSSA